jgi:hypothetical protein
MEGKADPRINYHGEEDQHVGTSITNLQCSISDDLLHLPAPERALRQNVILVRQGSGQRPLVTVLSANNQILRPV